MGVLRLLLGRALASSEVKGQKLGVLTGISSLGLDCLASCAYGPEAALVILMPLGITGPDYLTGIIASIVILFLFLYASYFQTITAYSGSGGAYSTAKANLGENASLFAAAALIIDYVLNVAVGISAGIGALVSAVPGLHQHIMWLCVGVLVLITILNLRGTHESGLAFAVPTYIFLVSFSAVLILSFIAMTTGKEAVSRPVQVLAEPGAVTGMAFLVLTVRAFANGCTAMTGVEAVSNGMGAFREPKVRNAHITLTAITWILVFLLCGIALACRYFDITAMDQKKSGYESVLSQIASAAVGRGTLYYVSIASLLGVLSLSANTSFVSFPLMCKILADDGYLPRAFTLVGRRLVNTVGIIFLSIASGLLLIVFGGITESLIPLFASGAFTAFTLAQAAMAVHWKRISRSNDIKAAEKRGAKFKYIINAVGAAGTGAGLIVIIMTKFAAGAWIVLAAMPAIIFLFKNIKRHHLNHHKELQSDAPLNLDHHLKPVAVVPIADINVMSDKALRFAMQIAPDVVAVHISNAGEEEADETMRKRWAKEIEEPVTRAKVNVPRLLIIQTPYRKFIEPMAKCIERLKTEYPGRQIAVVIPEMVERHWRHFLIHKHRAMMLKTHLLRYGGPGIIVITVPWYAER